MDVPCKEVVFLQKKKTLILTSFSKFLEQELQKLALAYGSFVCRLKGCCSVNMVALRRDTCTDRTDGGSDRQYAASWCEKMFLHISRLYGRNWPDDRVATHYTLQAMEPKLECNFYFIQTALKNNFKY